MHKLELRIKNVMSKGTYQLSPISHNLGPGFTLVELMVVITIILILTMVGIFAYRDLNARARDATRLEDLNSLRQAITLAMHDASSAAVVLCDSSAPPCEGNSSPADAN